MKMLNSPYLLFVQIIGKQYGPGRCFKTKLKFIGRNMDNIGKLPCAPGMVTVFCRVDIE